MTKNEQLKKQREAAIKKAYASSIAEMKKARLKDLIAAIEANNPDAVIRVLGIDRAAYAQLETEINNSYYAGAETVTNRISSIPTATGGAVPFRFDYRNSRAETWVGVESSTKITSEVEATKALVRSALQSELAAGTNPRQAALSLVGRIDPVTGVRTGGVIGMTPAQQQWIANAREELVRLDSAYFSRALRDTRYDAMIKKAIADGEPLTGAQIDNIITRLEARTLKYRGDVIARTESITALRAGQNEAMKQLIETGEVGTEDVRKIWSAALDGRTRDSHEALDGTEIGVDEAFISGGSSLMYPGDSSLGAQPGEIIQCRCSVSYRIDFIGKGVRLEKL